MRRDRTIESLPSRWVLVVYGLVAIGGDLALAPLWEGEPGGLQSRQLGAALTTLLGAGLVAVYAARSGVDLRTCGWQRPQGRALLVWTLLAVVLWATLWSSRALIGSARPSTAGLPQGWAALLVWKVLVTAPSEEFVWRGLVLRRWIARWGLAFGLVGSSLVFALPHSTPAWAFAVGLVAAVAYLAYGTLWAPMLLHAANNTLSITFGGSAPSGPVALAITALGTFALAWWARRVVPVAFRDPRDPLPDAPWS